MKPIRNAVCALGVMLASLWLASAYPAHADSAQLQALQVTICDAGTPLVVNGYTYLTVDPHGALCLNGASGGGGGGAVTGAAGAFVDGWSVTLGAEADSACSSDTATCTEMAMLKRIAQRLTTVNTTLNAPMQNSGGSVGISGSLPDTSGSSLAGTAANTSSTASELGATSSPAAGSVNAQLATVVTHVAALDTHTPAPGQTTMSGSTPVVIASNQSGALGPATHGQCSALCSNDVLKSSGGNLYSFEVQADTTLSAAAWWVIVYDATSLPANGAVTPAKCYAVPSGTVQAGGSFNTGGVAFATGITIGVSTTGCFTQTASVHAFIAGDFQ